MTGSKTTTAFRESSDTDMRKAHIIRRTVSAVLASASLFILASCGTVAEYKDNVFYIKKTGISYTAASLTYLPTYIGEEYAKCEKPELTLHKLGNYDTSLWLTSESSGRATTLFYNADKVTLPTWETTKMETLYICTVGDKIVAYDVIEDQSLIKKITDALIDGEQTEWPSDGYYREFDLLFSPEGYPMLYMSLLYGEFPSGNYIYERSTKRCVEIGNLLKNNISED